MRCELELRRAVVRGRVDRRGVLAVSAAVGLIALASPARAQLQPCCQGAGGSFCVLPWATGQQDCENQGGTLFQANTCTSGNECGVIHSVPAAVAASVEIEIEEEGTGETVGVALAAIDTVVLRMDPSCFTPPQAGTDCVIQTEIVELQLTGTSPVLGGLILDESPLDLSTGQIGPISAGTDGCFGPASSFFDVFFEVELPDLGQTLSSPPTGPASLGGTLELGGGDCGNLTGSLLLQGPALLAPGGRGVTAAGAAPAARAGALEPVVAAQTATGGQITSLSVTFLQSLLEIPALSSLGLALLALALAAAAAAALARR